MDEFSVVGIFSFPNIQGVFSTKTKVPTKSSKCQFVNSAKKVSEFTYQMTVLHECELQEQLAEGLGADQGIWGFDFKPHCSVSLLGMG